VAAIVNRVHEEAHGDGAGFFGFLEAAPGPGVVGPLLDTVAAWLRARGCRIMRGPASYDSNGTFGALVEGFDRPPAILMPYNRSDLPPRLERAGLAGAMDLLAWEIPADGVPDRLRRISDRIRKKEGIEIRTIDRSRFDDEVALVRRLYNSAWEANWGFVPLTDAEVDYLAEDLRPVVDEDFVLFASVGGEAVGFAVALPDYNQPLMKVRSGRLFPFGLLRILLGKRKIDLVRVITLGTVPEYRRRGLETLFYVDLFERTMLRGFRAGEAGWILETNDAMNRGIEACEGKVVKRYRVYERSL
jgi:GNAT superfamily N-acetyltransferase